MTTTCEASLAIEALGLGKAFGAVKAVDGLDLSVPRRLIPRDTSANEARVSKIVV